MSETADAPTQSTVGPSQPCPSRVVASGVPFRVHIKDKTGVGVLELNRGDAAHVSPDEELLTRDSTVYPVCPGVCPTSGTAVTPGMRVGGRLKREIRSP